MKTIKLFLFLITILSLQFIEAQKFTVDGINYNNIGYGFVEVIGKTFDPNIHEFGGSRDIPELDDNIVIDVIRDGYILKNKVIRPAIVVVNTKKETTTT